MVYYYLGNILKFASEHYCDYNICQFIKDLMLVNHKYISDFDMSPQIDSRRFWKLCPRNLVQSSLCFFILSAKTFQKIQVYDNSLNIYEIAVFFHSTEETLTRTKLQYLHLDRKTR